MTEIKRYDAKHFGDFEMVESNQGEWVRWEDVQEYLKQHRQRFLTSDEMVSEIRKSAYEMISKRMGLE